MNDFKVFKISEIFFTPNEIKFKKYSSIPSKKGDVAFISSKEVNNGIATYCNLPSEVSNCITVSTNGECLKCFYHNYNIVPSSDVEVLVLREGNLTAEIACYINACIEKHRYKFSHSNKPKNGKVYELEIQLPVDHNKNIDWKYITQYIKEIEAQYIKEIEAQYIKEIEAYLRVAKLDNVIISEREREFLNKIIDKNFSNFINLKIKDIFSIKNNPSLDKKDIIFSKNFNDLPYFTRTEYNNGIIGYAKEVIDKYKINGNSIAVGLMAMKFFYQKEDFCTGQFTKTLFPLKSFNENIGLFYLSFLNKNSNNLKANLIRDFDNIVYNIDVPNIKNNDIELFISIVKKLVISDLVNWYKTKLESYKKIV